MVPCEVDILRESLPDDYLRHGYYSDVGSADGEGTSAFMSTHRPTSLIIISQRLVFILSWCCLGHGVDLFAVVVVQCYWTCCQQRCYCSP